MSITKRKLILIALLVIALAFVLAGCLTDEGSKRLVIVSSAEELVFLEGEAPDLSKIVINVVDSQGNVIETVAVTQDMVSEADIIKLSKRGVHSIIVTYRDLRVNVQVTVRQPGQQITNYRVIFDCNEVYGANNTPFRGTFPDYNVNSSVWEVGPDSDFIKDGNKLVSFPIPTLQSFDFVAWYRDPQGTGSMLVVNQQNPYVLTEEVTRFYAKWEDKRKFNVYFINEITNQFIQTVTVSYGRPAVPPQNYTVGMVQEINGKRMVFKGWRAEEGKSYTSVTEDVMVYAVFEEQKLTVTFLKEDKYTPYAVFEVSYGGTFRADDIPDVFFEGRYTPEAYDAEWIRTETEDPLPDENITNIRDNIRIYIRYSPKKINAIFLKLTKEEYEALGSSAIPAESILETKELDYDGVLPYLPTPPQNPENPNKYNAEWRRYSEGTLFDATLSYKHKNQTVYVVLYRVKQYTVRFIGTYENGESFDGEKIVNHGDYITPFDLSYNELTYDCVWYTSRDYNPNTVFNFATTQITQSYTLYLEAIHKDITVYFCIPAYFRQSDSGLYDQEISANDTIFQMPHQVIIDPISQASALALYSMSVSSNVLDGDPPTYDFLKYRQDTDGNRTMWYDYNKNMWDFSKPFYEELKNYVESKNVDRVVLYAAVVTNELEIYFMNVLRYDPTPIFVPIDFFGTLYKVTYGEYFNPYEYVRQYTNPPEGQPALVISEPEGEDTEFVFGGWYTTNNYVAGTKVMEEEPIRITAVTTFYAKWIDSESGSEGLVYELTATNDSYEVVGYNPPPEGEDLLRIPQFYDGLPVIAIRSGAFEVKGIEAIQKIRQIREVELRPNLMYIDEGVFTSLTGVTRFVMKGESLYFRVADGILYNHDKSLLIRCPGSIQTPNIVVPKEVVRVAKEAFALSSTITSVTFESVSQLQTIDQNAFWECENLTTVHLPSSLKYICERAFYESGKLANIQLENGANYDILHVGALAFDNTLWLYNSTGQVILGNVLVKYKEGFGSNPTDITIADSVSTIADGAFSQEYVSLSLRTVRFTSDSALERIGSLAFNACPDLSAIYIGCGRLVDISPDAFSGISLGAILYVNADVYSEYLNAYISEGEIILDVNDIRPAQIA
jgi:hypothetical protein